MGHDRAARPEDLGRLLVERANAGDVESLLMLYEPYAVLHFPPGHVTRGVDAIREVFTRFLASRPTFSVDIKPTLSCGELALTSSRWTMKGIGPDGQPLTMGGTTAEVARAHAAAALRGRSGPALASRSYSGPTSSGPTSLRPCCPWS